MFIVTRHLFPTHTAKITSTYVYQKGNLYRRGVCYHVLEQLCPGAMRTRVRFNVANVL